MSEKTTDREIVMTRTFDAPREMVWQAWVDPKQLVQWWGPKGFTTTVHEMDVRPGGLWRLVMHGPDGTNYPNEMIFTDVVPGEFVSLRLSGGREGEAPQVFDKTLTFADEADGTRLTVRLVFATREARDENVRLYGSIEGGKQMFERLTEFLATKTATIGGAR
jgi:uncharacterized protein YndB with AHSA1/START domain